MVKKLSIIIPCFNCEDTLSAAVDSCYEQGFQEDEFEIILVDDKSTDNTVDLMKKLAEKRENIKYFLHDKNKGGGATRNTAVEKAENEVIFCLDSDDILPPKTLDKMYIHLISKKCDGVGLNFSTKFIGDDTNNIYRVDTFSYVNEKIPFESLFEIGGVMCPLYSVFMFTKQAFKLAGGYPENHGFDTQGFAWRFLSKNLYAETCPDTNYLHRVKAKKTYYLREYGNGNINFNWQKIFIEHLNLFNDEARRFILSYKCQDFTENIFDKLRIKGRVLDDDFQSKLGLQISNGENTFINLDVPVKKNSLKGIFFRVRHRLKKTIKSNDILIDSLKIISGTLSETKSRLKSTRKFELILALLILKIKRVLKIGLRMDAPSDKSVIDIVIPTLNKDLILLDNYLINLKKNLYHEIGNIYVVAPAADKNLTSYCENNNITFINEESVLGYGKNAIHYKVGSINRSGWLFQQLLKLSGDKFVSNKNYLIVDSDTILINKHNFIDSGKVTFFSSSEWNEPYFESFRSLFGYINNTPLSFTAHMMLFNVDKLKEMKTEIEKLHNMSWDQAYIQSCDRDVISGISDYDTYAHWYTNKYPEQVIIRPFYNKSLSRISYSDLSSLEVKYKNKLNSLSFHSYN